MSIAASQWAWQQDIKNPRQKLLLVKLADSANDEGVCWPSLRTLATHTGISKSALSRTARSLEESGLLRIKETIRTDGSKGANVYYLAMEGVSHSGGTGVSHLDGTGVSHSGGTGVSHLGRDTNEPPEEPKEESVNLAASPPPEYLGDRRWRVSSRPGRGPFVADLATMKCTCENRSTTPCRHLRAAAKAEERLDKVRQKALRDAVWDGLVAAFGKATEKQRKAYGANVTEIREHLTNEGIEATPEAYRAEVDRRVAALRAEWGMARVTRNSFVQNWVLAGKLDAPKQQTLESERFYSGHDEVL